MVHFVKGRMNIKERINPINVHVIYMMSLDYNKLHIPPTNFYVIF